MLSCQLRRSRAGIRFTKANTLVIGGLCSMGPVPEAQHGVLNINLSCIIYTKAKATES